MIHCFSQSREAPSDSMLPQLPAILDPIAMTQTFQERLFATAQERQRFTIRHCDVMHVRLKPESHCTVSYRLHIQDGTTRKTEEQILCGRAYPVERSPSQWEKARARPLARTRCGQALIHLPELGMVLWGFPNDRKMDMLPTLMNSNYGTSVILPQVITSRFGDEWSILDATDQLVHYVGEHTCTVRTDVHLVHAAGAPHRAITLYRKTYYNDEGADTYRVMQQLWDSDARRCGRLVMAEPLWYAPGLKTLWQLGLSGTTLDTYDITDPQYAPLLEQTGQRIAALHSTRVSCARSAGVDTLIDKLRDVTPVIARCRPSCRETLRSVVDRLLAQARTVPSLPLATLHGDLHLKNFVIDDNQVAVIDLDNVCAGSPFQDLGSLIAGLHYARTLRNISDQSLREPIMSFLRAYEMNVRWPVPRPLVSWYVAATLITERAYRCVTRLKAGRLDLIDDLIAIADRISAEAAGEELTC